MSIDLSVDLTRPVALRPLLPRIAEVLRDMLQLDQPPELRLHIMEAGQRLPAADDELRDDSSPYFLLSIDGEPETVAITSASGNSITTTMAARRTPLEFALGAATAIALGREVGSDIVDDWRFFGPRVEVPPEDLLARLRVVDDPQGADYRTAAERLKPLLDRNWERGS